MDEEIKNIINELRCKLLVTADDDRVEIFRAIIDNYCVHCGKFGLPCYCMRDE